jgi:chemotaxis protein methyltransferase CheR
VFNNTNAMDVVLCRNVLIYFDGPTVERVVGRLRSSLLSGGWLALGRSERVPQEVRGLEPVRFGTDFWYRRCEDDPPVQRPLPPAAVEVRRRDRNTPYPGSLHGSFERGDYGAVARELSTYLRDGSPSRSDRRRAMRTLAQACANLGRLEEAQIWCEEALAENRLDPRLHYLMASVLLERNQIGAAETSLERAVTADDHFVLAHFALGNLARRFRDSSEARRHYRRALDLLRHYQADEILPDSEGLTAGRLSEITERALSQC